VSRPGTPLRAFALCRAIVEDEHFPDLTAAAQRALLVVVIRHADHDGWFEIKYATLADELGCDVRNAGVAMRKAVPLFLEQTHQRRADGKRRACAFRLVDRITKQADEIVLLWTSRETKTSSRPGSDEIVLRPGSDEIVRARTALERSLNGLGSDEPDRPSSEEVEAVQTMLRERGLLPRVPSL
jgi:hypothetical protein